MRTISTALQNQFAAENASGYTLIKIGLTTTYYYTDCDIDLYYDGDKYLARGFELNGIEQSPGFASDAVSLDIDNVDRTFSAVVLSEDAANAPVSVYLQVLSTANTPIGTVELYNGFLSEWNLDEQRIRIKIGSEFMFWHKKSLRLPTPNCPWGFKSAECAYAGAETLCDKSPERCSDLGNYVNFGGRKFVSDVEEQEVYWGPK
jgi:phage-related protein